MSPHRDARRTDLATGAPGWGRSSPASDLEVHTPLILSGARHNARGSD
ncbi:hypothetical protein DIQ79_19555 [Mycolicibacterium smegmatis]|uniref:Uncharacterized protein n=1 Tax=Mycolicibacterium smegmatis (strain ATCC 700084 / mc(2)155) TaxID=246196 RepID=A0QTS7_MYCS2|nr:hypothetical protein MSMEG_1949 [Mycolicibacterium smegmatis MC2 155]TBM48058.1 hypothetical protein DIQ86_09820 [Mycolicibacterium smegmatis]TBH34189.1 hypothetical protein EYS45_18910 [Mycolicibacterium smegmatis MC2 155]TBM49516.1 hypothetical protein DIQ85_19730 [Mycolicibacterium smegmatis]TBM59717.1 hypothetical protein DIQ83_19790 [Mycolicibacterium smegmatis]